MRKTPLKTRLPQLEALEPRDPQRQRATARNQDPRQFKEPEKSGIDWDNMFDEPQPSKPIATTAPPAGAKSPAVGSEAPELRKAGTARTAAAMSNITPTDQMRDMIGRLNMPNDAIAQEPELPAVHNTGRPEPVVPNNVPALIQRAVAKIDPNAVNPEWHQVKHLPGYLQRPIRALGRAVFSQFTNTPVEDISVVANLGGQGPNSEREINGVAGWIKTHGSKVGDAHIDFNTVMPGYTAETAFYRSNGMRFLLVRDFAGSYIYAWPDQDSISSSAAATATRQLGQTARRLR